MHDRPYCRKRCSGYLCPTLRGIKWRLLPLTSGAGTLESERVNTIGSIAAGRLVNACHPDRGTPVRAGFGLRTRRELGDGEGIGRAHRSGRGSHGWLSRPLAHV